MEGAELTEVKYNHSRDTLNIELEVNNKRQNCKIGTVWEWGLVGGGRVNERD
jgi:hypothetical protein